MCVLSSHLFWAPLYSFGLVDDATEVSQDEGNTGFFLSFLWTTRYSSTNSSLFYLTYVHRVQAAVVYSRSSIHHCFN